MHEIIVKLISLAKHRLKPLLTLIQENNSLMSNSNISIITSTMYLFLSFFDIYFYFFIWAISLLTFLLTRKLKYISIVINCKDINGSQHLRGVNEKLWGG